MENNLDAVKFVKMILTEDDILSVLMANNKFNAIDILCNKYSYIHAWKIFSYFDYCHNILPLD